MDFEEIIFDQCTFMFEDSANKLKKTSKLSKDEKKVNQSLNLLNKALIELGRFKLNSCGKIVELFREVYNSLKLLPENSFSTQNTITTTILVRLNLLEMVPTIVSLLKRGEAPTTFIDKIDKEISRIQELNTETLLFHIKQVLSELVFVRSMVTIAKAANSYDINLLHSVIKDVDVTRTSIISMLTESFNENPMKAKQIIIATKEFGWNSFINQCLNLNIRRGDILLGPPTLQLFGSLQIFALFHQKWKGSFMVIHSFDPFKKNQESVKCFIDNSYGNPTHPVSLVYPEIFIDEYEYWIPSILATMVSVDFKGGYVIEEERKETRSFIIVKCNQTYFVWCGSFITQQIDVIAAHYNEMVQQIYYLSDL